ncbi:hypothetical protein V493_02913 [Pseudogymnoascus sp. VKM F-4281 (FW-2241)]|nr:hypothetical protein V493_02913 [Pseudogymnoascus sp. VKM F-4281 (FW-2241)]
MVLSCSPHSSTGARLDYSCYGTTGPYITDAGVAYNLTDPSYYPRNQTGQATMDALKACCKAPITSAASYDGQACFSNCKTTGLEQALEVKQCLDNYKRKRPNDFFAQMGCETIEPEDPGATMLGRSSSWGGVGGAESCGLGGGDDDVVIPARMARMRM